MSQVNSPLKISKSMEEKIYEKVSGLTADEDHQVKLVKLVKKKVSAILDKIPDAKKLWKAADKAASEESLKKAAQTKLKNKTQQQRSRRESLTKEQKIQREAQKLEHF